MLDGDSPFYLRPRPAAVPWLVRFLLASRRATAGARAIRALSLASLELHVELARQLDTGFERRGVLNVYATEESYAAGRREARSSGLSFEALDREEALELEPALGDAHARRRVLPARGARRSAAVRARTGRGCCGRGR